MNNLAGRNFCLKPIGVIRTPFQEISETPIQFSRSTAFGEINLFPEYETGLESIDGLSHLILIYIFHEASIARSCWSNHS
jgi:formylmethanofuran dehydrogenase subunit E